MSDEMVQFWYDFMIEHGVHERILEAEEAKQNEQTTNH